MSSASMQSLKAELSSHGLRINRSGKTRWIAGLMILGIAGTALGWRSMYGSSKPTNVKELITEVVKRGPFDHIVLEDGEIESSENQ